MIALTALVVLLVCCSALAASSVEKGKKERRSIKSLFQGAKKELFGHFMSTAAVKKVTKFLKIANRYEVLSAERISELTAPYLASSTDNVELAGRAKRVQGYLNIGYYEGSTDCTTGFVEAISVKMGHCHKVECDGDQCTGYDSYMVVGGGALSTHAASLVQSPTDTCDFSAAAGSFFSAGGGGPMPVLAFEKSSCANEGDYSVLFTVTNAPPQLPGQWAIEKGFATAADCNSGSASDDGALPVYYYATKSGQCMSNILIDGGIRTTCNGNVASRDYYVDGGCDNESWERVSTSNNFCAAPSLFELGIYFTNYNHRSIVCATDYSPKGATPKSGGKKGGVKKAAAVKA